MKDINTVNIKGTINKPVQLKSTPSGTSCCTVSVVTTRTVKKKSGEIFEASEFHLVELWGEFAEDFCSKAKEGIKVFFTGRLQTNSYEKDGQTKYIKKIVADGYLVGSGKQKEMYVDESLADDMPF